MSQRSLKSAAVPLVWAAALLILSACMSEHSAEIPTSATPAASGDGALSYTPASDGMIWIYDVNHDRILFSGHVVANDSIEVDPHANTISVSGQVVADKIMSSGDDHKIYFQPASVMADHSRQ